ncbi:MAG: putative addiction module component (TIGR02574 family) [Candidatus Omnitrophota bacterium]|jgi:putative addiction module component (TIGR02574 family)
MKYFFIMTSEELKQLPIEDKMHMMEILWDDLRERFDQGELPEAHKVLLDQRRKQVRSGKTQMLDWDTVKAAISRA